MINPFRLLSMARKADALVSVLDEGAKDPQDYRTPTFWRRVLQAAGALALVIPVAPTVRIQMKNVIAKIGIVAGTIVAVAGSLQSAPIPAKYQGLAAMIGSLAAMIAAYLHPSPSQA